MESNISTFHQDIWMPSMNQSLCQGMKHEKGKARKRWVNILKTGYTVIQTLMMLKQLRKNSNENLQISNINFLSQCTIKSMDELSNQSVFLEYLLPTRSLPLRNK